MAVFMRAGGVGVDNFRMCLRVWYQVCVLDMDRWHTTCSHDLLMPSRTTALPAMALRSGAQYCMVLKDVCVPNCIPLPRPLLACVHYTPSSGLGLALPPPATHC